MLKKIINIIIITMIICSTYTYAVDPIVTNPSDDQGKQESSTSETQNNTSNDKTNSEEKNTSTGTNEKETNTEDKVQDQKKEGNTKASSTVSTLNNNTTVKSNDANLKDLKVDITGMTPDFDENVTDYYLVTDLSVSTIKVTATTSDNKAKVTILGNKNLKKGENTININVKAEDGTVKKYYIHVTKTDNVELANAELESLKIEGFNIYPNFKSNIYNYNLNITENIEMLTIVAEPQAENATVEIEGNSNLKEGENLIKINVTAEDGNTIRIYKINTYISSEIVKIEEEDKRPALILIGILSICIIGLGIFIIIKNRK